MLRMGLKPAFTVLSKTSWVLFEAPPPPPVAEPAGCQNAGRQQLPWEAHQASWGPSHTPKVLPSGAWVGLQNLSLQLVGRGGVSCRRDA